MLAARLSLSSQPISAVPGLTVSTRNVAVSTTPLQRENSAPSAARPTGPRCESVASRAFQA